MLYCSRHAINAENQLKEMVGDLVFEEDAEQIALEMVALARQELVRIENADLEEKDRIKFKIQLMREVPRMLSEFSRTAEALERQRARAMIIEYQEALFNALREAGVPINILAQINRRMRGSSRVPVDPTELHKFRASIEAPTETLK